MPTALLGSMIILPDSSKPVTFILLAKPSSNVKIVSMDMCKLFILIVGEKTNSVKEGYCIFCKNYRSWSTCCSSSKLQSNKSFIDFECDRAKRDYYNGKIKILVLYNSSSLKAFLSLVLDKLFIELPSLLLSKLEPPLIF